MKKISIFMTLVAVVLGLASCSLDRDPVYQTPTTFVLNNPAMQDQLITLQDGGTLELTCSQPDYGYAAVTSYAVQMSLTEDFASSYDLEPANATSAVLEVKQTAVNNGIMKLSNIETPEDYDALYGSSDIVKVYFRVIASLTNVETSTITSNVVSYNMLRTFFSIAQPGFIYLVGAPTGWTGPDAGNAAHYENWKLTEPKSAIGSKIYTGVFDINAGEAMFRFYTALTGWDADSYGSQTDDNPVEFPDFAGGEFNGTIVKGKGAFSFPNWKGGKMTITVDMSNPNNMTLNIQEGEVGVTVTRYIYLVGSISGWKAPATENEDAYTNFRLADSSESGIYEGTFAVEAGHVNFRFALELNEDGWDNATQIGAAVDDGDVASSFNNGLFTGPYVAGKGNWAFDLDNAGTIHMIVNTNDKTVNYTFTQN